MRVGPRIPQNINPLPNEKIQTIIHLEGKDSTSTNVTLFSKITHKISLSLSLFKKIIVCVILYIIMVSIFFPLYNFQQNTKKWVDDNKKWIIDNKIFD